MENGISLCIPYPYTLPDNSVIKSLYRIADYEEGQFIKADPLWFSEYNAGFNPRYIRMKPGENPEYYSPIIKKWKAVPKNGESEKSITESYPYSGIMFFEVVADNTLINSDDDAVVHALKSGIKLPEGVSDYFLLVIDQDDDYYRTVLCRRNYFKERDNLHYIDSRVEDVLHTVHSLKVFYISKTDIFNTADFGYLTLEDGTPATTRLFYKYDSLPKEDGELYLYRFEDYLPSYISKYLRRYLRDYKLTKNEVQKLIPAIRDALSSQDEEIQFFNDIGYRPEEFVDRIAAFEKMVIEFIDGSAFLDSVLTKILEESPDLRDKYVEIAKDIWLQKADEQRQEIEGKIVTTRTELKALEHQLEEKSSQCTDLKSTCDALEEQRKSISAAFEEAVASFDKKIGDLIAQQLLLGKIGISGAPSYTQNKCETVGSFYLKPSVRSLQTVHEISDIKRAKQFMEYNLKSVGLQACYAAVIADLLYSRNHKIHSVIVPGYHARVIADAIAYSVDGGSAAQVSITSNSVDYKELHDAIDSLSVNIVLIENLLDTCNEYAYAALNKDFPEKTFIMSFEQDDTFGIISKGVWNYGILLNTEIGIVENYTLPSFRPAIIVSQLEYPKVGLGHDGYNELYKKISDFKLPFVATETLTRFFSYIYEKDKSVDPTEYIDSIFAKFCVLYPDSISAEDADAIVENLPENMKEIYRL